MVLFPLLAGALLCGADRRIDGAGDEPVALEIPVFSGGLGSAFLEDTARRFEATQHGAVRVNLYGEPRMNERMRVRVLTDDLPDATFSDLPWVELARAGKLVDLTPHLDGPNWEGDARWRDTFLKGVLETWTIDGRIYGIPLEQSCWTLFYNRALFRAHGWTPPRTWDEFFALCDEIHTAGVAPLALPGVYLRYGDAILRAAFYNLAGPGGWRGYNELAPGARTDPRFIRAAEIFQRVTLHHLVPGWEGMTHTAAQLAFLQGRTAFVLSGSWFVNEMRDSIPPDFELGAMNFPIFPDGIGDPTAVQGSNGYFFAFAKEDPQRVQHTVDFLRFLTSRERAQAFARELDAPVAVRGVPAGVFSARMQDTAAMFAQAREIYSAPPNMLLPPGMAQTMVDARNALARGNITPEQFGARLESAAAAIRTRAATDSHEVTHRFPRRGAVFLALLGAAFAWIGWAAARRLRTGTRRTVRRSEEPRGKPRGIGGSTSVWTASPADPALAGEVVPPGNPSRSKLQGIGPKGNDTAVIESAIAPEAPASWFGPLRIRLATTFVLPSFLIFALVVLLPGLASFAWALTEWDGIGERAWVGLFNFEWLLFESDVFWRALKNNLFLMLVPTAFVVPLALFFAALIQRGVAGAKLFRACFLFPNILGGVAASLIWLTAYEPANGFINSVLVQAGGWLQAASGEWWLSRWLLGFENFAWLSSGGDTTFGMDRLYWALIPIYVWLMAGFNLVLYLAAMQGIDAQYYEAAQLDGAGPVTQFFRITLPMIREVVAISAVFIVIGGLNTFEMVWLLTGQDPLGNSHVLATWMIATMFQDFQIGRATAIAVVMFVLVLAGSAVTLLASRRGEVEM
ncbi:MAG: extracellular solute-binding protein [Opitutaceae bacterium]